MQTIEELLSENAYYAVELAKICKTNNERGDEIAALKAAAETTAARTAQALVAAKSLLTEQDAEKLRAGMAQIIAFAEAPETARRIAEKEAALLVAQTELDALKAAL